MYKVCRIVYHDNDICKYVSCVTTGIYQLEYNIGEWTKPKVGKIFVFDSLENAQDFTWQGDVIFKCEAKNPTKAHYRCFKNNKFESFWSGYGNSCDDVPKGTYFADEIKPLERV